MTTIPATHATPTPALASRSLLYVAWAIVLLLTVPEIVVRALMAVDAPWMMQARIVVLALAVGLTFAWPVVRPLRGMLVVFLVIYGVEGGLFLTLLPQAGIYQDLVGGDANRAFFGERVLRLGAVVVMLAVLLAIGLRRRDFYLAVGDLRATAEPIGSPGSPSHGPPSAETTRSSRSACCCSSWSRHCNRRWPRSRSAWSPSPRCAP